MTKKPTGKQRRIPQQRRSQAMVTAILDATAQVLISEGYDRATTNKIAAKAGVSIGSLYQYFANKEELVGALNTRLGTQEMNLIRERWRDIDGEPLTVIIREAVKVMVESHHIEPELHKVLVEQVPRVGELEKINEIDRQIQTLIREKLLQFQPRFREAEEEIDLIIFVVFNIVETLTHQAVLYRPELLADERLTDEISRLIELYLQDKMEAWKSSNAN